MNTTEDFKKAMDDEMKKDLGLHIRLAKKQYEEAQTKMLADLQTNPISTITWSAEGMVKTQAEYEMWLWLERGMAENDPREVLATVTKEVQYRVRSFFGSNSTSMFSNAVERAKADAYVRLAETLEGFCKHYGI
jgi:hypothetical protein